MQFFKILTLLALLVPALSTAMEQPANNTQNSSIQNLHSDHIQNILLRIGSIDEIGQCARALSQTNKQLYNTIQNATPVLIQQAPHHTPTSEAQAALAIRTKAARPWLQKNLTDESFNELQIFLDEHLGKRNPSQAELIKVRFLIRSLPRIADCQSCPALLLAGDNLKIVKNLLAAGVNVNQIDDRNIPPLEVACWLNSYDLAHLLLNARAKISPQCFNILDIHEELLTQQGGGLIIQEGPLIVNNRPITKRGPTTARYSLQTLRALRTLLRTHQIKQNCSIQ